MIKRKLITAGFSETKCINGKFTVNYSAKVSHTIVNLLHCMTEL